MLAPGAEGMKLVLTVCNTVWWLAVIFRVEVLCSIDTAAAFTVLLHVVYF
jgi:hypothetical protein